MPFTKGQSGNPNGRPPKSRALTDGLETALNKSVLHGDKKIAAKKVMTAIMVELITNWEVRIGSKVYKVQSVKEWVELCKFVFSQIDGAPKGEIDLNADGIVRFIVQYADGLPNNTTPPA